MSLVLSNHPKGSFELVVPKKAAEKRCSRSIAQHSTLLSPGRETPSAWKTMTALVPCNVAPNLMEGSGVMKSFGEIIQNQLLFLRGPE